MKERMQRIKMLLIDVDGVMTDGGIILGSGSLELRRFHVQDGMGITLARMAGLMVGILSSRDSDVVRKRAHELGIEEVQQGFFHKEEGYQAILQKHRFKDEEVAYIGDDLLDIPVLKRVGFSVCVADGAEEAKQVSHYVTRRKGGEGAVREVVDMLLEGQGKREEAIRTVLRPSGKGANP